MFARLWVLFAFVLAGCDSRAGMRHLGDDAALLGILVGPEAVVVPVGATVQLTASGLYDDRTSRDLTARATWRSDDDGVASVSDGLDQEGVLTGHAVGRTTIWARADGVASPAVEVEVTDQALEALSVEPGELTVAIGQEVALASSARWSNGTVSDATGLVRWITGDPAVVTIEGGRVVGAGTGSTTIRAQWDDVTSNEVPVTVVASASPDLRVASLVTWASGDDLTVQVTVENTGDAGAGAFWVDAFLDPSRDPVPGDEGDAYESISYVGPGASKTVALSIPGAGEGGHEVVVLVDSTDDVAEADEGDNVDAAWVDVDGGLLPADIVVDDFEWLGDGQYVYYWIAISNYGDEPTGAFYVDLYLDLPYEPWPGDEGDYYFDVPSIGPWETVEMEALVEMDCVGCWSWVQADSMDEIVESYEDDNVAGPLVVTN